MSDLSDDLKREATEATAKLIAKITGDLIARSELQQKETGNVTDEETKKRKAKAQSHPPALDRSA